MSNRQETILSCLSRIPSFEPSQQPQAQRPQSKTQAHQQPQTHLFPLHPVVPYSTTLHATTNEMPSRRTRRQRKLAAIKRELKEQENASNSISKNMSNMSGSSGSSESSMSSMSSMSSESRNSYNYPLPTSLM